MTPKVTLLSHTPQPEKLVAAAARMCYSAASADTIWEGWTRKKPELHRYAGGDRPRKPSGARQLHLCHRRRVPLFAGPDHRHRIASFSVQSQRYVREKAFEYVLPPSIAEDPHCREIFEKAMAEDQRLYDELAAALTDRQAARLEEQGMAPEEARKAARKMANEDARFVLPNACCTKMMMTMDTRSLYNFFRLRCCNRAQWEIREVARQMLEECRKVAPHLFQKAGPACLYGPCPEGKMSCGKMAEVRQMYGVK